MERLRPLVGADDAGTVFIVLDGPCGDRIAPVAAFLRTNIKPFLEPLIDRADFGGERAVLPAGCGVLKKDPRFFQSLKGLVSIAGLRRHAGVPDLIGNPFASVSFSYV